MATPRERMVVSAALLIRERGAHATAISDVLAHSGAPKGSAYHYFPGGRTQLLCEAVDYAGDYVAAAIGRAEHSLDLLDTLVDSYRKQMLASDFRAGCPVAAVSVEAGEPGEPDKMAPVTERAAAIFDRWTQLMTDRLIRDGINEERAGELAVLVISGIEGAILLARVRRDPAPLDIVRRQLRDLIEAATPDSTPCNAARQDPPPRRREHRDA